MYKIDVSLDDNSYGIFIKKGIFQYSAASILKSSLTNFGKSKIDISPLINLFANEKHCNEILISFSRFTLDHKLSKKIGAIEILKLAR